MLSSKSPIVGRLILAAGCLLAGASGALAQTDRSAGLLAPDSGAVVVANGHRSTLGKMFRRITTEFNDNKLEDVMKFLEDYTGATIEVHWADTDGEGLDRDQGITLKVRNLPALTVLERVLAKASSDALTGGNTWQMTEYGSIEVGPKSVLNRTKRTELYDIHDLLIELPRYDRVPQIDLQSLLQQSQQGGGGGGQSPFTNDQDEQERDGPTLQEKGEEIMRLITTIVEPEEWVDGGGEGGTIRYYNGNLLVHAPDYMHRQINGYSYWPSHTSRVVGGRRYVSLTTDNSIGTIDGFAQFPVTAVVGGRLVSSGPGGSKAPAPGTPASPAKPGASPNTPAKPGGATKPGTPSPAPAKPATKEQAKEPAKTPAKAPAKDPVKDPVKKDKK